jgi:SAM-dependent methyltransferase
MLDAAHTALLRVALQALSPPAVAVALDIGCGSGQKTGWLAAQCAPHGRVIGLDLAPEALRQAATSAAFPATWLCADAHDLPLATDSVDLIWCVAVLGLLAEPLRALQAAQRVLRPGGTLVLAQATQCWVRLRPLRDPLPPAPLAQPPADDLGYATADLLAHAGFANLTRRAYLLDPPDCSPAAAQLPLLDHPAFDPDTDPELHPVLFVVSGTVAT